MILRMLHNKLSIDKENLKMQKFLIYVCKTFPINFVYLMYGKPIVIVILECFVM